MDNKFITNYTEETFLDRVRDNLRRCSKFCFSVSFIKKAGLALLSKDIELALQRGVEGKIITSTYQNFTDIESLKNFLLYMEKYPSFECHLDFESFYDNSYTTVGYHTKGYYFEFDDKAELIVGSSNITRYALLKNIEWDLIVKDEKSNSVFKEMLYEYEDKWNGTYKLDNELVKKYLTKINYAIERWDMDYDLEESKVNPNYMQRNALKELNRYRVMGLHKALIIAAAGSGKTFLAAFDVRNFQPKKMLYIVHEGSIMEKALETFQMVFGNNVSYGIYNADNKELNADFLFTGNQIMSKNLNLFSRNEFDYIILDECHRATAPTYRKIIEYFEPEFLLGLTATPERMDNEDVFDLFDANVPFELRLKDAIINELVVPFHYYGIRDKLIDYGLPKAKERKLIAQLSSVEHCAFIHEKIEEHRPNGKLKALVFCKDINHARMISEELEEYYHTAYLTGRNKVGERIRAFNDLQDDSKELEVLCTVDILNEGVDIPGCNMVLFLRPTESSTVFIQQLGRGLRKYENKEYVTVLDFIGNSYKRSVQIAFALGSIGETFVLEKRLMHKLVEDNFAALGLEKYGVQINIDKESQKEIIEYIDQENFNRWSYLEQDYKNFKKYINSEYPPKHTDYLYNDCAPNILRFIKTKKEGKVLGCYYNFLKEIEDGLPYFTEEQVELLKYVSNLLPLVRKCEFLILKELIEKECNKEEIQKVLIEESCRAEEIEHAIKFMKNRKAIYEANSIYSISVKMDDEFKKHLKDLLEYGLNQYETDYKNNEKFLLWHNYRMDQVQLKCLKDPGHTQKGTYFYGDEAILFASLKKDATVEERLNYKDKFIDSNLFQWECENNISANELKALRLCKYVHIFVRKVSSEHGLTLPFTYVGEGSFSNERRQENIDNDGKINITYLYDIPMKNSLPDYLQYDFGIAK